MKIIRRQCLHLAAGAAALPAVLRIAYPTQPVRVIVGFAAGGAGDILGRLMEQWLDNPSFCRRDLVHLAPPPRAFDA
jgi:tripartite-type tricarboxylate transporter receptor subunit TctC